MKKQLIWCVGGLCLVSVVAYALLYRVRLRDQNAIAYTTTMESNLKRANHALSAEQKKAEEAEADLDILLHTVESQLAAVRPGAADQTRLDRDAVARDAMLATIRSLAQRGEFSMATRLFNEAMLSKPVGSTLSEEERAVKDYLQSQNQPVTVQVRSDGFTSITIIPGRHLGTIQQMPLQMRPGNVIFSGRRIGYKDVEKTVNIRGDSEGMVVFIACAEMDAERR